MLIPRKGRVIGSPIRQKEHHSLLITPFEKEEQQMMNVTAVGPDVIDVQVGDIAILPNWGATIVKLVDTDDATEEQFYVVDEDHILAVFRDDAS